MLYVSLTHVFYTHTHTHTHTHSMGVYPHAEGQQQLQLDRGSPCLSVAITPQAWSNWDNGSQSVGLKIAQWWQIDASYQISETDWYLSDLFISLYFPNIHTCLKQRTSSGFINLCSRLKFPWIKDEVDGPCVYSSTCSSQSQKKEIQ